MGKQSESSIAIMGLYTNNYKMLHQWNYVSCLECSNVNAVVQNVSNPWTQIITKDKKQLSNKIYQKSSEKSDDWP